ncbi:MAG: ABC transporter ATP-binding protein [Prevotella sp.]|nr:ABC transporter ATP-binding protein [Prevotella sp.]
MYIEVTHLTKRLVGRNAAGKPQDITLLDDISFEVDKGEFICILGFSGCGKSTLLNLLAGFDKPTGGDITIDGKRVEGASSKRIMIFQNYGLLPWRSVERNVELGLERSHMTKAQRRSVARDYLHLVGLDDHAASLPAQLSGGQQQRVALARGLAVNPDVLFMDEPFSALDPITRNKLQDDLLDIVRLYGKTVVFVTHDIYEAVYLADRVIVMSSSPGHIRSITPIELPRPRQRNSSIFNFLHDKLYNELHAVSGQSIEYYL